MHVFISLYEGRKKNVAAAVEKGGVKTTAFPPPPPTTGTSEVFLPQIPVEFVRGVCSGLRGLGKKWAALAGKIVAVRYVCVVS